MKPWASVRLLSVAERYMLVAFTLSPAAMARTISSCSSGFNFRFIWIEELSHCSKRPSTRLIVSSLIPLISVKLPQRVMSRSLPVPSTLRLQVA
jgi:hypothetical protein